MMEILNSRLRGIGLIAILFASVDVMAQLRHIDPAKLPQDQRVQAAYSRVLPVDSMVRNWSSRWTYETPKRKVADIVSSSLRDLRSAQTAAPQNEELALLTGLVAHFVYNVDVDDEKTFKLAVHSFEEAGKLAPADYRAKWFLALHLCQTFEVRAGMEQLLALEAQIPWNELPADFWDDYIRCSATTAMPAHTLRAIDHAVHLGEPSSNFGPWIDITRNSYKATDTETIYSAHDAWRPTQDGENVRVTSDICGMEFSAHGDWRLNPSDVSKGICTTQIETGPYPSTSGTSVPTLLILTRAAKPEETLDAFVQSLLKARYMLARPTLAYACPVATCLAFDIVDKNMYGPDGGGHLLAVAFAGAQPGFPGLLFEEPWAPPKPQYPGKAVVYHPPERLQRLPGSLYTIVLLDSNASIFAKASADFESLLKSIRLD